MIRIIHLSVVHPANEPRIYERECRTLAGAGFDVTYLVPGATPGRDEYGVRLMPLPSRSRATRWMSARDIVSIVREERPHVVHVHDPELLTLFPLLRAWVPRLVYDMHDYVPEQVMAKDYIPARIRPAVSRTARLAQRALAACGHGAVGALPDDAGGARHEASPADDGAQLPARGAVRGRRADPRARRRPAPASRLHRQPVADAGMPPHDRRDGAPRSR